MSEPVSNVEIEDVLSSIRRLVSEENRPTARRDSDDSPRKPSRLVLTPSLLVPVPDTDEVPESHAGDIAEDTQDDLSLTSESDADLSDPGPATEDAAENDTQYAGELEPDQPDPDDDLQDDFVEAFELDAEPESDALLDLSEFEADSSSDTDTDAETDTETEFHAEPENDAAPDNDSAPWSDPESTLFEAVETVPDLTFLPSGKDEDPEIDAHASDDADAQHEPDADDNAGDQAVFDGDVETADSDAFNTATLSAKIAVLEAKIGETQDQWEPDGETDDDYAGTPVETIQWRDHTDEDFAVEPEVELDAEPELVATPEPEPEPEPIAGAEEALDFLPEDETILDEESLRELVADIVRQELQGALGERITRNVRKLVRREIHRALTAQELD